MPAGGQAIKAGDNQWKLSPALSSGVSVTGVKVEVTAAARCAIYRITFPVGAAEDGCIVIDPTTREPFNAVAYDPTRRLLTGKIEYNGGRTGPAIVPGTMTGHMPPTPSSAARAT